MKKRIILISVLAVLFTLAVRGSVVLDDVQNPLQLHVTSEQLYVVDGFTIRIYSLNDFHLIKKFGKEGEGPKEFAGFIAWIYFRGDHIVVNSVNKVSYYTLNGKYIREKRTHGNRAGDFCPVGNNFAGVELITDKKALFMTLNLYDPDFAKIKELFRVPGEFQPGKAMRVYSEPKTFSAAGKNIYVTFDNDFIIRVFGPEGKNRFTISHNYNRIKITDRHKKIAHDYYRTHLYYKKYYQRLKPIMRFPDYLPAIKQFVFSENAIYVQTNKIENEKKEFLVFSFDGKWLGRTMLPLRNETTFVYAPTTIYAIKNRKLYELVENEEEERWELFITPLPPLELRKD